MFNLISKKKLIENLRDMLFKMAYTQNTLKSDYDNKELTEWSYYKRLWILKGELQMLETLIDILK